MFPMPSGRGGYYPHMEVAEPQTMSITDKLLSLYRIDQQIQGLTTRVNAARRYYEAQQRQLTELESRRSAAQTQARQLSATAANLETDVKGLDQRIEELRKRMNEAQSAKEYKAVLTELNTVKADRERIETEAIESLSKVDAMNAQIAEIEAEIEQRRKVHDVAAQQLDSEKGEIASRLEELKSRRTQAAAAVPAEAMAEFEQLARRNEGEAMAEIIEEDRRRQEYCCGACNMTVPVEVVSVLLSRATTANCPSCRRILYLSEELRGEFDRRFAGRS